MQILLKTISPPHMFILYKKSSLKPIIFLMDHIVFILKAIINDNFSSSLTPER